MSKSALRFAIGLSIALAGSAAHAQAQAPASTPVNPAAQMSPLEYGAIISNANAKKVAAAALAEAAKMGVPMIVAITDTSGNVVYQERQDAAILGGTLVAPQKARSAVLYKRPTKAFEDAIAPGGVGIRFLRLEGAVPIEGGLPIIVDNKIIGGIGMSGGTGVQDGLAAKAVLYYFALQHFEQETCPPSRRMLFLERHPVARAHRSAVVPPALSDADAPHRCVREAAAVLGVREMGLRVGWVVARAQPQVVRDRICIDHLVRVHLRLGVPDRLELMECLDQLGTEHLRQELRPRLPVTVFARQRSATSDYEVGRLVEKRSERLDAGRGLEVEVHAGVQAALAEVPVEGAVVSVTVEQPAELA